MAREKSIQRQIKNLEKQQMKYINNEKMVGKLQKKIDTLKNDKQKK